MSFAGSRTAPVKCVGVGVGEDDGTLKNLVITTYWIDSSNLALPPPGFLAEISPPERHPLRRIRVPPTDLFPVAIAATSWLLRRASRTRADGGRAINRGHSIDWHHGGGAGRDLDWSFASVNWRSKSDV